MFKFKLTALSFVIAASAIADGNVMMSKEPAKSTLGALVTGQYMPTKEKVLGEILKGALENMHYTKKKINDNLSKDAYKLFLERIDYGKQFLLKSDVRELSAYEQKFDDELNSGNLVVINMATKRMEQRIKMVEAHVKKLLSKPVDLNKKVVFETDSKKREFVRTEQQLKDRWTKMLTLDVVSDVVDKKNEQEGRNQSEKMKKTAAKKAKKAKKANKPKKKKIVDKKLTIAEIEKEAREKILKRYEKVFKRLKDVKGNDRHDKFYNSLTRVYDPHTHYLIPEEKEDFDIDMSGKLEGIGALLSEENSFIKVEKIIPGSASWRGKELKAEDIILAVGQGDKAPVDIVNMSLKDAVKLIRGKKGTIVKLSVKSPDGTKSVIAIVRDEVIIEATYVKSSVLQDKKLGVKIGYIVVPKFYRDFEDPNGRNCSNDVRIEIEKLKKQNVEGIILDLRNNGGGALEDARLMGGLFIKKGPIVQVKGFQGNKEVLTDTDGKIYFKKPVVVLVNRFSASASEIVAAALQDYGRAIVVGSGEQTHGKGTVQAVIGLDRYAGARKKLYAPLGALKITIQMFYRVNGGSTQFKGVKPDIILPDPYGYLESGEKSLDFAIPYGEIGKVPYKKWEDAPYDLSDIVAASAKRTEKSPQFKKISEATSWYTKRREESSRSLNIKDFQKYRDETFKKSEEFKIEMKNENLMISGLKKTRDEAEKETQQDYIEALQKDPVIDETLHIFKDILKK